MKTTGNTILITGGSAGIGFEIARLFIENDNQVIIVGRDEQRLEAAGKKLKNITTIQMDVTKPEDVELLVKRLQTHYPELNVVINNAASSYNYDLGKDTGAFGKAEGEMLTNYLSVIRLNEHLLPLLKRQSSSAIVNVTSIIAIIPAAPLPTYAASKAALHSYTVSLRYALKDTSVKVFEIMPPLVNTEFSASVGGENGIPPVQVAQEFFNGFETDTYQVRVAGSKFLFDLYRDNPEKAMAIMNGEA